jgi:hypothetical protein
MKAWFLALPGAARVVTGACAALLLLVFAVWVSHCLGWLFDNLDAIDTAEPRIARLAGYVAAEEKIKGAITQLDGEAALLAFPASMDSSQAGAQLQQELRAFAETAGLTVRGSQLDQQAANEEEGQTFDELTVQLNMVGEPMAIDDFLTRVYAAEPLMLIESINVSKPRLTARQRRRQRTEDEDNSEQLALLVSVRSARLVSP